MNYSHKSERCHFFSLLLENYPVNNNSSYKRKSWEQLHSYRISSFDAICDEFCHGVCFCICFHHSLLNLIEENLFRVFKIRCEWYIWVSELQFFLDVIYTEQWTPRSARLLCTVKVRMRRQGYVRWPMNRSVTAGNLSSDWLNSQIQISLHPKFIIVYMY